MDHDTKRTQTQRELEATVKGYQLKAVADDILDIKDILKDIQTQTKGVVSFETMETYVNKRIDEKTEHLVVFKKNTNKLAWIVLALIITDIGTRILQVIR